MTLLLAALLAVNAVLHFAIPARFGLNGNAPPLGFGLAYVLLAAAVWLGWPYAYWAVLAVVLVGSAGLLANYGKITHDKSIEHVILGINAILVGVALYALFGA